MNRTILPVKEFVGKPEKDISNVYKPFETTTFKYEVSKNAVNTTSFSQELIGKNYIGRYGETAGASNNTIYTVPSNYNLYVTQASLSWGCVAHSSGNVFASLYINGYNILTGTQGGYGVATDGSVSTSFAIPMKLTAGQSIVVYSQYSGAGNSIARGAFVGYLVPINEVN